MPRTVLVGAALILAAGCMTSPMLDNPMLFTPGVTEPNPTLVPLGPKQYHKVFENVLKALADYGFEIPDGGANRYTGRIETLPRIAPGIVLLPKPGSPDLSERVLATLQTYRHRVTASIEPGEGGSGFFVQVIVYKELEDLPRPLRATAGAAIFRTDNNVERQFEVIDPAYFDSAWIPKGRDTAMEQAILARIRSGI